MSPLAVLLRVLLCLALILNGSVPVVHAAMRSHTAPGVHAIERADTGPMAAGGCHDEAMSAGDTQHEPSSLPADEPRGDCCSDEGDCRSTCAQHCAVSIPALAILNLSQLPATGPLPVTAAPHPDPRLRDRIRPPIA
ncbi:MAG: CopL family metal-binding regulatory protein [Xanthomonadaceae bacterium]|nr:CopL family metal-binding regulatory protein [Xanthomonadaceae bacterium]